MSFDTVHNYFERLVFNEINEHYLDKELDEQQLADMACIALNRIPPRYIRFDIDMSFYMTTEEHIEHEETVSKAVRKAYKKLLKLDRDNSER
ncbi:late competence development ComFB family protein [Thiomicrorhabdus sp. ZW0627]|uniref:late competence development ComFB family protein n=1 Tax=Thiomicrorhabdus sp. ZW0627 TaxID=3039774 RepID=UPI0024367BB1|nr:late competence development ComFB family protein [Thiomicrorhabdus sp. ZW0627]MDG6774876.1 late competence development ComFB family protein [Thiomicrorhabdus sp. ZW0627]